MTQRIQTAGYIDPYDIMGEDGWFGMDIHEQLACLKEKGFIHGIGFNPGYGKDFRLYDEATKLIHAIRERELDMGPWTVAYGPDTLWAYCYLFKNSADAVLARLIMES